MDPYVLDLLLIGGLVALLLWREGRKSELAVLTSSGCGGCLIFFLIIAAIAMIAVSKHGG